MDFLLLLCRVDSFLVCESSIFMHNLRGWVRTCADSINCGGTARSLHSIEGECIVRRFEAALEVSAHPSGSLAGCPEF
ncbi:unnamed protein product [Heligmosomoides polygyrus]|uniref:Secreted protein n=1 Tax=Heligmosomoides polygyrus TaxID=6339 RepID=A0A183G3M1_HELPZ|nr:unnamed protein product [Heligmosomoides polygyrus]